ncbi:Low-affinity potassium transport protein [Leucoagaricus sp. SymC.cos]|nr:Low-affinity potassium transport protein [Leucoagaricus sp. SymC.cos]
MPTPDPESEPRRAARVWASIKSELNFYRIHLVYFTVTPLIFSGIFYASNGRYHISYIDALFNCLSSICVCGLATVNLSSLTAWQQAILAIQMTIGHPVFVSWFMVLVRRHYFARKFEHILAAEAAKNHPSETLRNSQPEEQRAPWSSRMAALLRPGRRGLSVVAEESSNGSKSDRRTRRGIIRKLRPDMIRRMDDAPKLVNPSGWVTEGKAPSLRKVSILPSTDADGAVDQLHGSPELEPSGESLESSTEPSTPGSNGRRRRRLSDPGIPSRPATPTNPIHRYETMMDTTTENQRGFPRHQTIEFAPTLQRPRGRPEQPVIPEYEADASDLRPIRRPSLGQHYTIHTQNTIHTAQTHRTHRTAISSKNRGYGGFPMPHRLIGSALNKLFPRFKRRLTRTVTIPVTTSLVSTRTGQHAPPHAKAVPYISFNAIVGRNSAFHLLTNEQLEEIGGVEYRALNALLWFVAGYFLGIQLIALTVIAPYISTRRWSDIFKPPNSIKSITSGWFALYQVVSSFSNTGSSLVDQSMIPFQKAYAMIVFQMVLILGGNCAYPILYVFWVTTKLIPRTSRLNETLHFLLDHPRRCYTYLFPSYQTWFLLTVVLLLTSIDWFFFMLLDIGNNVIDQIALNTRFAAGLFQAVAVRAAGFAIVPMNSVAPAVKVLYTVMMYISIYPIALSVRSTNVYEEQSLGVFEDVDEDLNEENFETSGPSRVNVWSRYLFMHARRQLAFDIWWLAIAIFLICIVERHQLNDPTNNEWFNVFNITFEIVSAYGSVGLSLGIANQNYSLSGAFSPLSKLIVCAVILRGRHRGLPVAIDRAILLPSEFNNHDDAEDELYDSRSRRTSVSQGAGTGYNPHPQYSRTDSSRGYDDVFMKAQAKALANIVWVSLVSLLNFAFYKGNLSYAFGPKAVQF